MPSTSRFVFISYARDDGAPFAQRLSTELKHAGHQVWMDTEQLASHGGEAWEDELTEQLLSADLVLVILTPQAVESPFVKGEFSKARKSQLTVVPALFVDCDIPLAFGGVQHVDFRTDHAAGLANVLDKLARLSDPAAEIARDQRTLERLTVNRGRAVGRGVNTTALDGRIAAVRRRIEEFSADLAAQTSRVDRELEAERRRSATESARPAGPGVRQSGERPPLALGDTFHDRVDQQRAIADALLDPKVRVVTILGRGGMGKTALALRVLSSLLGNGRPSAPALQGIAYLHHTPTQAITLDRLLHHITQTLPDAVAAEAVRRIWNRDLSTEDRIDQLLDLLPEGLIVVLLDNFEDLLDERGWIRDADVKLFVRRVLTGGSTIRLLVTARAAINLPAVELRAERQITLRDGLPVADAVALLREIDPNDALRLATASASELEALAEITYGIPRAIELLANRLEGPDSASPLQGLVDVARDLWTRETVVERLVEASYRRLPTEARHVANALAVYSRPVAQVAVDFLLQPFVPGLRLDEVVQPLVNARLVSVERSRDGRPATLGLHRIDRDFLYQRLPSDGAYSRAALHRRAAEFYRRQRTVGARGWRDITELDPQECEYKQLVLAGEFDAAAILLGEYAGAIAHCGHPTVCRDLYEQLPDRLTSDRARVNHKMTALIWKAALGLVSEALAIGEQALREAVALGDQRLELEVRQELVTAYRYASDSSRSREHAEQIARRLQEWSTEAAGTPGTPPAVAFDLALAYTYQGDIARATPLAHQYHADAVRSGIPASVALALNGLVVVYVAAGRFAEAVRVGREAEALWQPGFNDGIAYVQNLMGIALYHLHDFPAAAAMLTKAAKTADEWDSPRPQALATWNLSLINLLHGVHGEAEHHGRDAEVRMTRLSLDRFAHAPREAAEAAGRGDHAGVVRALLMAAQEWLRCSDLFPGPTLTAWAHDLARRQGLDTLAAEAGVLDAQLRARQKLPTP
jgi:tetratricopeptide (TPR) repeat protein